MNTFIANENRCPKCGKPYVFVGEAPEYPNTAGKEPFCTCALEKKPNNTLYGWACPVCGRVYAPWVDRCDQCPRSTITTVSY